MVKRVVPLRCLIGASGVEFKVSTFVYCKAKLRTVSWTTGENGQANNVPYHT